MMTVNKGALLAEVVFRTPQTQRQRTRGSAYHGSPFSAWAPARTHIYTLSGFVLGFLMALGTLLIYDHTLLRSEQLERHTTASEFYQTGYMTALQQVARQETSLQQRLLQEVRVLCLVLTCPEYHQERAAHVLATWGRRCSKLIFASSESDEQLGAVSVIAPEQDTHDNLWIKTYAGFRHVYEQHFEQYDWFLKADDDTYVIMENLRYMLYAYDPEAPVIFGSKLILPKLNWEYMSGGASYVLSKQALRRFMSDSYYNESFCSEHAYPEDVCMGQAMQQNGVHLVDSRFAVPTDRTAKLFPISLALYLNPSWNLTASWWLTEMTAYPMQMGMNCCSSYSVAFHYIEPEDMYLYEFLIYKLQMFGMRRPHEQLPEKMSIEQLEDFIANNFTDKPKHAEAYTTLNTAETS